MDDTPLNAAREFPDEVPRPHLPKETLAPATWRGIIATAVGAVVVFMLLNVLAGDYLGSYGKNRGYWIVHQKWTLLDELAGPVDTLILGDSSCNQGLEPAEWERLTGESALNLCTIGDTIAYDNIWMLERYIAAHGAPKRVIIGHVYDMWWRDLNEQLLGQIPEPWGFWTQSIAPVSLGVKSLLRVAASKYFPLYSQNTSLREASQRFMQSPKLAFTRTFNMDPNGFMPWYRAIPQRVEADTNGHIRLVRKGPFVMSKGNEKALAALTQLADQHDIDMHIVRSPNYEKLVRNPSWRRYNEALDESLEAWADQSPRTKYHGEPHPYANSEMENADHVTVGAALDYTREIAKEVTGVSKSAASTRVLLNGGEPVLGQPSVKLRDGRSVEVDPKLAARMYSRDAFSMEFPIRLKSRPSGRAAIFSSWDMDANRRSIEVGITDLQLPYFAVSGSGGRGDSQVLVGQQSLRLGRDHLVTVTFEQGNEMAVYLDGVRTSSLTQNVPTTVHHRTTYRLGRRDEKKTSRWLSVDIGSFEFIPAALTSEAVANRASALGAEPIPMPELKQVTQPPGFHWFGYYDKQQFSPDQRYLLVGKVGFQNRTPDGNDTIEVGVVDLENGNVWRKLATTKAWNWQQGTMLQWRPGSDHEVLFNDREDDKFVTRVVDVRDGTLLRTLPHAIYHVAPDGKHALGLDFARLSALRRGYGYAGLDDPPDIDQPIGGTAIYSMNLDTGETKNLITLEQVVSIEGPRAKWSNDAIHYFNHLQYSPSGERFLFLHRWPAPSTAALLGTRIFTANVDGSDIRLLSDERDPSHFTWRGDDAVLVWMGSHRGYTLYDVASGPNAIIGEPIIAPNGHQTYIPGTDYRWMITDNYPENGRQALVLFDTENDEAIVLANPPVPALYSEFRVDFHPRLSPDGSLVAIDSAQSAGRQQWLISIDTLIE